MVLGHTDFGSFFFHAAIIKATIHLNFGRQVCSLQKLKSWTGTFSDKAQDSQVFCQIILCVGCFSAESYGHEASIVGQICYEPNGEDTAL